MSDSPTVMAKDIGIRDLRNAIPEHCFQPSAWRSSLHIFCDLVLSITLASLALIFIPILPFAPLRCLLWLTYGYLQGLVFTGIWILAHECGHGALFATRFVNDCVGFVLHTLLLVPYFAWKYTHARHHIYTNHIERDTAFVPRKKGETTVWSGALEQIGELNDAPLITLGQLVGHQLLGWPVYLLCYASGGVKSVPKTDRAPGPLDSHFDPTSSLFLPSERPFVFASSIGISVVAYCLWSMRSFVGGGSMVLLLYGLPYLWVNNWLIAITYLHHTHETSPHYEASTWTFLKGALTTVDRPYGFVGRHIFHGIIDFHVVHHMFSRIPFYHAEEATEAIKPILGDLYRKDDTPFWTALWRTFASCKTVEESAPKSGILVWK